MKANASNTRPETGLADLIAVYHVPRVHKTKYRHSFRAETIDEKLSRREDRSRIELERAYNKAYQDLSRIMVFQYEIHDRAIFAISRGWTQGTIGKIFHSELEAIE